MNIIETLQYKNIHLPSRNDDVLNQVCKCLFWFLKNDAEVCEKQEGTDLIFLTKILDYTLETLLERLRPSAHSVEDPSDFLYQKYIKFPVDSGRWNIGS